MQSVACARLSIREETEFPSHIATVFLSYLREHQTYHIRDRTRNSYLTRNRIEKQPKINNVHSVGLDQWPFDDCSYAKRALH